ncbi:hypothetical protein FEM48_Zijuj08G0043000 [Ziziphus jujuba var. spinosa]|uniref:Uncharacterized protein n=1 Tax=Ziziphus jujuba var. spinosa TaxID=714518 RepID=A0A978UWY3_ZIZJJ|nr:hypothetical protein FEM48_Zijuj08G0043000 [Ziziphus jujuba var. spinosa]
MLVKLKHQHLQEGGAPGGYWRVDAFLVLDFRLRIVNCVRTLHLKSYNLAFCYCPSIPELFPSKDEPLLVRWYPFRVLYLSFDIVNGARTLSTSRVMVFPVIVFTNTIHSNVKCS